MVRKFQPVGGRYGPTPKNNNNNSKSLRDLNPNKSPRPPNRHHRSYDDPPKASKDKYYKDSKHKKDKGSKHHHHHHSRNGTKSPPDAGAIKSRKEIKAVTMNMSGKAVMGMTPKYKINMIQDFLYDFPDVVFFQVS